MRISSMLGATMVGGAAEPGPATSPVTESEHRQDVAGRRPRQAPRRRPSRVRRDPYTQLRHRLLQR